MLFGASWLAAGSDVASNEVRFFPGSGGRFEVAAQAGEAGLRLERLAESAWVVWRDRGLTVLMWFTFALLLQSEFQFLVDRVSAFTTAEETPDPNWRYFWQLLWPFLRISALLVIGLFVAGLLSLARAKRARTPCVGRPPAAGPGRGGRLSGCAECHFRPDCLPGPSKTRR
jgi:hypothetical protein